MLEAEQFKSSSVPEEPPEESETETSAELRDKFVRLLAGDDAARVDRLRGLLVEYDAFLEASAKRATAEIAETGYREVAVQEIDEARGFIRRLIEAGVYPLISVRAAGTDQKLREGLKAKGTWIPGVHAIVGTLGRAPYLPKRGEPRTILQVRCESDEIGPRFTGKEKSYQGVVAWRGGFIPAERLSLVELDQSPPAQGQ